MARLQRALRTFDSSGLTGTAQNIGAVIPFVVTKVTFINESDVDILVSDESSQDDIRIPANGSLSIAEGDEPFATRTTDGCVFYKNVQLTAKQVTGAGTGDLVINALGID